MRPKTLTLGLRPNLLQFVALAVNNLFVGSMVGIERTAVPILGQQTFHLASWSVLLSFIVAFGLVKGPLNLVAGRLGDHWGRKPILIAGWLLALPVPWFIIAAPTWRWVIAANLLLGANQGFAWSMTVTAKIDLVGPLRRGLALGINEFSGYAGVSGMSVLAGYLVSRFGARPIPFLISEGLAVIGLLMAGLWIRETLPYTRLETPSRPQATGEGKPSLLQVFTLVSMRDRTLFACSQAGFVNKVSDTAIWGLVPLIMAAVHLSVEEIGWISGCYAMTWSIVQLGSGFWSDHIGRKLPIVLGQLLNAIGLAIIGLRPSSFTVWVVVALLAGMGTGLLYPVLLSAVGDAAHPTWRGSALGVYRMWRDGGYAIGGLLLGWGADWLGIQQVVTVTAALVVLSGIIVAGWMRETLPSKAG